MTTPHLVETTGTGIVEHVARAIGPDHYKRHESLRRYCIRAGDSEEEALATAEWAHGEEIRAVEYDARIAICATIEHLRDNVSDGMGFVGGRKLESIMFENDEDGTGSIDNDVRPVFRAMLSEALADLDHPSSPDQEVEKP